MTIHKSTKPLDKSLSGILKHTTPDGECMIWNGATGSNGYGHINYGGKSWTVSRLVMVLSGVNLRPDQYACHTCDNPSCINPDHLFPGTNQENILDAQNKGRVNTAKHGTRSMYHNGCKCSECLSAEASYAKQRRAA